MQLINKTIDFVRCQLEGAEAGHDWSHIQRVYSLARHIHHHEGGDFTVIALASLLHDIADPKFHGGDENLALSISRDFLQAQQVHGKVIEQV